MAKRTAWHQRMAPVRAAGTLLFMGKKPLRQLSLAEPIFGFQSGWYRKDPLAAIAPWLGCFRCDRPPAIVRWLTDAGL